MLSLLNHRLGIILWRWEKTCPDHSAAIDSHYEMDIAITLLWFTFKWSAVPIKKYVFLREQNLAGLLFFLAPLTPRDEWGNMLNAWSTPQECVYWFSVLLLSNHGGGLTDATRQTNNWKHIWYRNRILFLQESWEMNQYGRCYRHVTKFSA